MKMVHLYSGDLIIAIHKNIFLYMLKTSIKHNSCELTFSVDYSIIEKENHTEIENAAQEYVHRFRELISRKYKTSKWAPQPGREVMRVLTRERESLVAIHVSPPVLHKLWLYEEGRSDWLATKFKQLYSTAYEIVHCIMGNPLFLFKFQPVFTCHSFLRLDNATHLTMRLLLLIGVKVAQ